MASRLRRQHRQGALRSALVAVAVFLGVLAMHGLVPHSAAHADGGLAALTTVVSAIQPDSRPDSHAGHQHEAAPHAPGEAESQALTSTGGDHGDHGDHDEQGHGHGAELCLAFLSMVLALLLAVAVWSARPMRAMVTYRRVRLRILDLSRPAEPPCLTRLSILRC